jgi:hypothetical protein
MSEPKCPPCHADRDGDCEWSECPQKRDGEPEKSGRHCPYDAAWSEYYEAEEC